MKLSDILMDVLERFGCTYGGTMHDPAKPYGIRLSHLASITECCGRTPREAAQNALNWLIERDVEPFVTQVAQTKFVPYWPYCEKCHAPFDFDADEPFAHCHCGTTEWGHPRPYDWVPKPIVFPKAPEGRDISMPGEKHGTFWALAQGRGDYVLPAFPIVSVELGTMLVLAATEEAVYLTKEQVKAFFDLRDPLIVIPHGPAQARAAEGEGEGEEIMTTSPSIAEIIDMKRTTENEITALIRSFEDRTGLRAHGFELIRARDLSARSLKLVDLHMDVRLE